MILTELEPFKQALPEHGRLLALDYGRKNLGIALSDVRQKLAFPRRSLHTLADCLKLIVAEEVVGIIIGLPWQMNGEKGSIAAQTQQFVDKLAAKTNLPIYLYDERLSSKIAAQHLQGFNFTYQKQKQCSDGVAAMVLLQEVLAV